MSLTIHTYRDLPRRKINEILRKEERGYLYDGVKFAKSQ